MARLGRNKVLAAFFLKPDERAISLRADDFDEQRQALAILQFASQRWVVSNPTGIGRLRD